MYSSGYCGGEEGKGGGGRTIGGPGCAPGPYQENAGRGFN